MLERIEPDARPPRGRSRASPSFSAARPALDPAKPEHGARVGGHAGHHGHGRGRSFLTTTRCLALAVPRKLGPPRPAPGSFAWIGAKEPALAKADFPAWHFRFSRRCRSRVPLHPVWQGWPQDGSPAPGCRIGMTPQSQTPAAGRRHSYHRLQDGEDKQLQFCLSGWRSDTETGSSLKGVPHASSSRTAGSPPEPLHRAE